MRFLALACLAAGCASAHNTSPPGTAGHDLGDHLEAPGSDGDMGSARDGGAGDLAHSAGAHDLAGTVTPPDLASSAANDLSGQLPGPTLYANDATTLYTVDPQSFALTTIGSFGTIDAITDVAVDSSGSLVAISATGLYTVDATSGAASLVADQLFTDEVGLAYLADGRLIGVDSAGNLSEISWSTSGSFTFTMIQGIGSYGGSWQSAGDLVGIADNTLYGLLQTTTAGSPTTLAIINNTNGNSTPIGTNTGAKNLQGAARSNGYVLGFSSSGDIVQIDAAGHGTVVKSHPGKSFSGAATSPDAS
jgi:hypothetical protein